MPAEQSCAVCVLMYGQNEGTEWFISSEILNNFS